MTSQESPENMLILQLKTEHIIYVIYRDDFLKFCETFKEIKLVLCTTDYNNEAVNPVSGHLLTW